MNNWFISDTHFHHAEIIEHENRPFDNVQKMNDKIISNINERVKPEDNVYFLGDFCFYGGSKGGNETAKEILKRLNGNWKFCRGNHDKNNTLPVKIIRFVLQLGGIKINCIHDPINVSEHYPLNLVGHIHGWFKYQEYIKNNKKSLIINVSVEQWNYRPVSWEEIYKLYQGWKAGKIKADKFDKEALKEVRQQRKRR